MPRLARCLPALFLALFLSGPAGPPQAAAAQWSVGAWTGNSYVNRTGAFSHCIMNARYNSGITLYFMQFSDHDLFIGISAPDWSLDPHSPYTLTLMIDGKEIRSARARCSDTIRTGSGWRWARIAKRANGCAGD